ncbi:MULTISPECIES: CaiB/BaiF CoA transferase family protein [unclassified Blastococcus]
MSDSAETPARPGGRAPDDAADGGRASSPYAPLRVVEIADDPAGEYTGKLLADLGAEVVKVEPPEGVRSRHTGPFAEGESGPEAGLPFRWYNTTKRSVVLDDTAADRERLQRLVGDADVLISTLSPAEAQARGVGYADLLERHPGLVVVAVTAFGLDGPWAHYRASDLTGLAVGGLLHSCGYDDHSIPPIRPGGDQAYATTASFAHTSILLALLDRRRTGRGQLVDVSMHAAGAVSGELSNPYWFYPRAIVKRQTCRHAQPVPTQPALFECADGRYVYFAHILSDQRAWEALIGWMQELGVAADLVEPEYRDFAYRQARYAHVQDLVEVFFLIQDADSAYHGGQRRGLPIGVLNAPEELLDDEHLRARDFFVPVEQADGRTALQPGSPFRFSAFTGPGPTRAPRLGEHTDRLAPPTGADAGG